MLRKSSRFAPQIQPFSFAICRYTTRGSMCVLRRPLHGAECLSSIVIRGNDLSPSLHYPFVYFAFAIGLKTRPITSTKNTCHYTDYAWIITDTGKKEYKRRETDYKVQPIKELSKFMIIMAMAAIGLNSNVIQLIKTGGKPIIVGASCWCGITVVSLIMQHVMKIW